MLHCGKLLIWGQIVEADENTVVQSQLFATECTLTQWSTLLHNDYCVI